MGMEASFFKNKLHMSEMGEQDMPSQYKFLTSSLVSDKASLFS